MLQKNVKRSLATKIIMGVVLGSLVGFILKYLSSAYNFGIINDLFKVISFFAGLFTNALKMLVTPVIFVSIVNGTLLINDIVTVGRIAAKTLCIYLITTIIAVTISIGVSLIVKPGLGASTEATLYYTPLAGKPIQELSAAIIPNNPIEAMASGNAIQIIVFAIFFGIAIAITGKKAKPIVDMFKSLNVIIAKLVDCVVLLAPYGIFCLIVNSFKTSVLADISGLFIYFFLVIAILLFQMAIIYSMLLHFFAKLNPVIFFKKIKRMLIFSFTTSSSYATVPFAMNAVTKRCGVSRKIAAFTIPLGSTINMDGTSIMLGVATVFIFQAYNIPVNLNHYLLLIVTATMASIGTTGIPGVGIAMLSMVLQEVGLPTEGVALILSIDRVLDMARTSVNVTGDCVTACVVAQSEGELNHDIFNDPMAGYYVDSIDLHNMHVE
jgi:Na+/H+-dicarboxylate symporter